MDEVTNLEMNSEERSEWRTLLQKLPSEDLPFDIPPKLTAKELEEHLRNNKEKYFSLSESLERNPIPHDKRSLFEAFLKAIAQMKDREQGEGNVSKLT